MENIKIFFTRFTQIGLVAINTVLIAKGFVLGIFLASFTISMLWCPITFHVWHYLILKEN
jgi:hypothetical protein